MTARSRIRLPDRLLGLFAIDLRTLALFRIALGLLLFVDLWQRFADLSAFYSDFGVFPREVAVTTAGAWRFSLHLSSGSVYFEAALFVAQMAAALALVAGWRTRLATVISFVLLVSLQSRSPLILIGADNLLSCLLFWGMLLPLGARASLDAALAHTAPPEANHHRSWASAGLLLQVLSVYFFTAWLKSDADWWPDGNAVYYALNLDRYVTPIGEWLRDFPGLMRTLSYGVYGLEWAAPLLVLCPWFNRVTRGVALLLLALMHLGFLACLTLGLFPFVSLCSLTVLLGGGLWDWLGTRLQLGRGLRVHYDRDCAFCRQSCRALCALLMLPRAEIRPAQDSPRADALMQAHWSWVVIDYSDTAHLKFSAFTALLKASPWLAPFGHLLSATWLQTPGNRLYDFVANHRAAVGGASAWLLHERPVRFVPGHASQIIAAIFLFGILAWNLSSVQALPRFVGGPVEPVFNWLRIDQNWNMFAPRPYRDDGWMVVPGRLVDGSEVDVLHPGQTPSFDKPAHIAMTHATPIRWRTYRTRLWQREYADQRGHYARYLCRDWNLKARPQQRLLSLRLIYMLERTPPPGETARIEQRVLWRHDCLAPATRTEGVDAY